MFNDKKTYASDAFHMPCGFPPIPLPEGDIGIADLSSLFDVSHRTLHFYEEKELISSRRLGQMRIYGRNEVSRMWLVHSCREIGMSIADIQNMLADMSQAEDCEASDVIFESYAKSRLAKIDNEAAALRAQKRKAEQLLALETTLSSTDNADAAPETDDETSAAYSKTDRECLRLMAAGSNPGIIAEALGLDVEEARSLEESILSRLEARNRLHAVTLAAIRRII